MVLLQSQASSVDRKTERALYAEHLVKAHGEFLMRIALVGPADGCPAEAERLAIEAIEALAFRGEPIQGLEAQRAFLRRCLHSLRISEIRRRRSTRCVRLDEIDEELTTVRRLRDRESRDMEFEQILAEHLARLTDDQREVLKERLFGDLKIREIAEATGKAEGTVSYLLSHATAKLRKSLSEDRRFREIFEDRGFLPPPPPPPRP